MLSFLAESISRKCKRALWLGPVVCLILLGCAPVEKDAGLNPDTSYLAQLARCNDEKFFGDLDKQVNACSWLLESGKLPEDKVNYIWLMRGWAHYVKGNYKEAIPDLTYFVNANPKINDAPPYDQTYIFLAHSRIAYAHAQLGETDTAIEKINTVIEMNSHLSSAYQARGKIYHYALNDLHQAVSDYSKAMENIRHHSVLVDRAKAFLELKEYDKAILDFRNAIEVETYPRRALNGLAWFLATTDTEYRNANSAIALANRLNSMSDDPRHLDTLAAAYAAKGRYARAIELQQKAISSDYRFPPLTEEEREAFRLRNELYDTGRALYCPGMLECN